MRHMQIGDPVRISKLTAFLGSTAQALLLFDADGLPRTLQSFERLIIDRLMIETTNETSVVLTSTSSNVSSSVIAQTGNTGPDPTLFQYGENGCPCLVGQIPYVVAPGASSANTQISVVGSGRIVEGKTQGVRPNWRESMVRGD